MKNKNSHSNIFSDTLRSLRYDTDDELDDEKATLE
jgi:hypothetical protein